MRRYFYHHLHPIKVRSRSLHPVTTLGLGLMSLALFLVLAVTGVLLMIYYVPTTRGAYASMQDIQYAVALGRFVRTLHRWAAHGMVLTAMLHLVRVVAMGAFRGRELNWFFGLALLLLTLGLAFTGYLLPWDQVSFWAVTVGANLLDNLPLLGDPLKLLFLGGDQIGQATLLRFYTLHVALLPFGVVVLAGLHAWRIRKDGGLAVCLQEGRQQSWVPAWPHLVLRELAVVLLVIAFFSLLATLYSAPLGSPADVHQPANPDKAPWYFIWIQEMVSYSAPVGGWMFPGFLLLLLALIPFVDRDDQGVGRWFGDGRTRLVVVVAALLAMVAFVAFQLFYTGTDPATLVASPLRADLLNPASGMLALAVVVFVMAGWLSGNVRCAVLACLAVLAVAVIGFMMVGLLRGPDWVFYWPWEEWPGGF
jgi:quinol-cytochrome oxidoreductase complex cytochrome b subunit